MYRVTATATIQYSEEGDHGKLSSSITMVRQLPTFFLDPDVHGITSVAHAKKIALWILDPFPEPELNHHRDYDIHYSVVVTKESDRNPTPPPSNSY